MVRHDNQEHAVIHKYVPTGSKQTKNALVQHVLLVIQSITFREHFDCNGSGAMGVIIDWPGSNPWIRES